MGIVERVDWEDIMPGNIRFMRIRVRVNPWIPVVSGFMLKMDNGSKTWIQCRYERVHKLCNRCGMLGHTQGQCTLEYGRYRDDDLPPTLPYSEFTSG